MFLFVPFHYIFEAYSSKTFIRLTVQSYGLFVDAMKYSNAKMAAAVSHEARRYLLLSLVRGYSSISAQDPFYENDNLSRDPQK